MSKPEEAFSTADVPTQVFNAFAARDVKLQAAEPAKPVHDLREETLHLRQLQHELEFTADHRSS